MDTAHTSGLLRAVFYAAWLVSNATSIAALFILTGDLLGEPYAYVAAETAQPTEWATAGPPAVSGALCAVTVAGLMWVGVVRRLHAAQPVTVDQAR